MKQFIFLGLLCGAVNLWAGDFLTTCDNIKLTKATLSAECKADNGGVYKTALRLRGITNRDGRLTMETNTKVFSKFHKTCENCSIDSNGILAGTCKNDKGQYLWTSLDIRPAISNYNGTLVYPR